MSVPLVRLNYPAHPVLIVDDNPEMIQLLALMLRSDGVSNLLTCSDGRKVLEILEMQPVSVVLLDLWMPGIHEEELLRAVRESYPGLPVIMVTGENDMETAIRCMRLGANDYLSKPVEPRRLFAAVQRVLEMKELKDEYRTFVNKSTRDELECPEAFSEIVGESLNMRAIFHYLETIARSRKPVLITGESGVGKELIARAVHRLSNLPGPFVSETVAGYDETMFNDALFGHVRGAYTSAASERDGLVSTASGGTLFLDEIGDLPAPSQVKLLRLLQEKEYRPLGSDEVHRSTTRFVFATNRDLQALQKAGTFRADLFYRISVHQIEVPPLRKRPRDIAPLVRYFVGRAAQELEKPVPTVPRELFNYLHTYPFPGNVRELEGLVFDAVAKTRGNSLSLSHFAPYLERDSRDSYEEERGLQTGLSDTPGLFSNLEQLPTLEEAQRELISEAMARSAQNQGAAARILGISRTALNKRLKACFKGSLRTLLYVHSFAHQADIHHSFAAFG